MKIKKALALMLATCMLTGMVAGCGSNQEQNEDEGSSASTESMISR